ncbi:MAG: hypothetical protein KF893_20185 [Caldilineaceae bacterium]|nr:hypothetical protein [Caldilineaceae bacterium]
MDRPMNTHIQLIGWLNIALGILGLLIAIFAFTILLGVGLISRDNNAMIVLGIIATLVSALLGVLSIPGIIAGYGLLRRRMWARYLALVVGFLNLFNVPLGTLVGGYTIWVLLPEEVAAEFRSGHRGNSILG